MNRGGLTRITFRLGLPALAVALAASACAATGAEESGSGQLATLQGQGTATTSAESDGEPAAAAADGGAQAGPATESGSQTEAAVSEPVPTSTTEVSAEDMTIEDAELAFAACMRETYPEWPDPRPDGGFGGREAIEALGIDPRDDGFVEALDGCRSALQGAVGGNSLTPEEQAEQQDQVLALFACVREQPGFEDLPDPDFSQGAGRGFGLIQLFQSGAINPEEFRAAIEQCAASLGVELRGGPRRGPGGSRQAGNGNA